MRPRPFLVLALASAAVILLSMGPAAFATVGTGCTAQINGTDVTADHDTAGTAVHVDYHDNAQYTGEAAGKTVGAVKVAIQIAGFRVRTSTGSVNGSKWADTIDVKKYAWAGIGLYHVTGSVRDDSGAPICAGAAYICVDGKSPFLTAAGIVALLLGAGAIYLLVRGLLGLRWRSRLRVAYRFGGAGLLGGIAVPLLLQQSCVVPLTRTIALGSVGGGLVGMILLALLVGGRRRRQPRRRERDRGIPAAPASSEGAAPTTTTQELRRERQSQQVYRFVPPPEACVACRNHAEHRIYRTAEAADADRAHPDCNCEIVPQMAEDPFLMARFGSRDVIDDRDK